MKALQTQLAGRCKSTHECVARGDGEMSSETEEGYAKTWKKRWIME